MGGLPAVAFHRYSVFDLVRRGLKPAAALQVTSEQEARQLADGMPATALSRFGFTRDACDNLVLVPDADQVATVPVQRMLYVGRSRAEVHRVRDIEEAIYRSGGFATEAQRLHEELGIGLGFPACCASAFARSRGEYSLHPDSYASLVFLGWHLRPINWRLNHVVAGQYHLPLLVHVPCSAACQPTIDLVDMVLSQLYDAAERRVLEAVLSQGGVVYPDDRVVLFRPLGAPVDGALQVTDFNVDAHSELIGTRESERCVARNVATGFRDEEVECVRVQNCRIEVRVYGTWQRYPVPEGPPVAPPILLTTEHLGALHN
jgi:hypothetical protein